MFKKFLYLTALMAVMLGGGNAMAQSLEPDFEGEVVGVYPDGTTKRLEKQNTRIKTGGSVYVAGFAVNKTKTKVLIEGGAASVRFRSDEPLQLIARAKDNNSDPMSIVRVFKMKSNKKQRSAVIAAAGTFNTTSNDMEYLPFEAKKYGESSYLLTFEQRPAGEYGVIISNPNNVDEKMVIVSTFGIDDPETGAAE
ncbi:hypothetical protein [uncultured Alistipes sp.]|uniref:hypothetical protein n=1 Tax=uncultured Alistipes sp. TaxID=538949 RepID=UPI002613D997|nr:hypothetical protein [uncultured Alistipes sp.]